MAPNWPITLIDSGASAKQRDLIVDSFLWGIMIVHWEALRLIDVARIRWDYVIADEVHGIKNRKAKRTKALKKIPAIRKRALSGTPLVNRPDELWSILNWLFPKKYTSYWRFYREYVKYVQHPQYGYHIFQGSKNLSKLRKEITPFTLRRRKKDVLADLPDKYYTHVLLDMAAPQARAYKQMTKESLAWVGENEDQPVPAPVAIARFTRLRQFACAFAEINEEDRVQLSMPSPKINALVELCESTDQPVVVFSQFKQMITLAEQELLKVNIVPLVFTGDTSDDERSTILAEFGQTSRVFLATVQAGGVGIDGLQVAQTAVFLDRTFSPATNLQAEDRLHRLGQKNAVQILIMQSKGTVDEVAEEKLELKWETIRKILGDPKA